MTTTPVATLPELVQALHAGQPQTLVLQTALVSPHALTLPPGYALTSADKDCCTLSFGQGDGLGLTANNEVRSLATRTLQIINSK